MCCRSEWQERMYIYKWHEVDQTKHEIFCVHFVCNEIQVKVNLESLLSFFIFISILSQLFLIWGCIPVYIIIYIFTFYLPFQSCLLDTLSTFWICWCCSSELCCTDDRTDHESGWVNTYIQSYTEHWKEVKQFNWCESQSMITEVLQTIFMTTSFIFTYVPTSTFIRRTSTSC